MSLGFLGVLFSFSILISFGTQAEEPVDQIAKKEYVSLDQLQRFDREVTRLTDHHGQITQQLQNLFYQIELQYADKMSREALLQFQKTVAGVGGKLHGPQIMPEGGISFWLKNLHPWLSKFLSSPVPPRHVNVSIIGSGLTGVAAAIRLSQELKTKKWVIAVFDSRGVAEGASGQNGGNFQPIPESFIDNYRGLVEERYKFTKKNHPELDESTLRELANSQAVTMLLFGVENGKIFRKIAQDFNIDADISDAGWMRIANSAEDEVALAKDVELATSLGVKMEMWSAEKITRLTGIQTEFGGRFTPDYGNYHPYKFITQVFEKLVERGILLYTHTKVEKIDWSPPLEKPVILHTARGLVDSDKVIIATDAYTAKLIPEMKTLIEPFQSQVVTYEHVEAFDQQLNEMSGWTITERDGDLYTNIPKSTKYFHNLKRKIFGMLLVGGGPDRLVSDADSPPLSQEMFNVIVQQTIYRFKELANRMVSNTWTAVFAFTPKRMPYLSYVTHDGLYDPRLIMAAGSQGYGGGMSLFSGTLAAEMAILAPEDAETLLRKYDPYRFYELPELTSVSAASGFGGRCKEIFSVQ